MPAEIVPLPIARVTQANLGRPPLRFVAEPAYDTARITIENLAEVFPRVASEIAQPSA